MAAIFPVQQEPTSRPAIPQARCGIAPTLSRCDPSHPRLAESSKHIPERHLLPPAALGNPRNFPGAFRFLPVLLPSTRRRPEKPAAALPPNSSSWIRERSSELSKFQPQFPRRPEQRILHGLFRGPQGIANRAQLQSLVMLHLEHHSFPRRQPFHRFRDPH